MKRLLCILSLLLALLLLFCACKEEPPANDPHSGQNPPAQQQTSPTDQTPPAEQTPPAQQTPPAEKSFEQLSAKEQALYLLHYEPLEDADVSSYALQMDLLLSGSTYGYALTATAQTTLTVCLPTATRDLFYAERSTANIRMSHAGQSQTLTQYGQDGYTGGKMFSSYQTSSGDGSYAVFSRMSAEEFLAHKENTKTDTSLNDLNENDCTHITCKKTLGGYEAVFSNFTVAGLDKLSSMWTAMTDLVGAQVTDLCLTLSVDEALMPKSVHMELSFGLATTPTQMEINLSYSGYNTTLPTSLDLSSYREITDLRTADAVKKAFSRAEEAKSLSFNFSADFDGEGLGTTSQSSELSITATGGVYSFRVEETINNTIRITQYEGGTITQTSNGGTAREDITDADARRWISEYIKPVDIDLATVLDASSQGDTYTVRISKADPTFILRILGGYSVSEEDVNATATLTVRLYADGSLRALDYLIEGEVELGSTTYDFTYRIQGGNYDFD